MSLSKARQSLLERLRRRHQRDREGCFVVEGVRGAKTALHARAGVRFAVISPRLEELDPGGEIPLLLAAAGIDVTESDDTELAGLADTVNPQGVLLVCDEPEATLATLEPFVAAATGILIADAIQDPANLGTMIRTSAALGLAGVIALDGTVDPWNAKVVRGTAGACFFIPIVRARCEEVLPWVREKGIRLFGAAGEGVDIREIARGGATGQPGEHKAGRGGASREPSEAEAGRVSATEEPSEPEADPGKATEEMSGPTVRGRGPWALAVGNEGAGLRDEVHAAAEQLVAVPIDRDIDSLNAAVAAAILMWEMVR
jgi:TrmH family RNA methyltransferase